MDYAPYFRPCHVTPSPDCIACSSELMRQRRSRPREKLTLLGGRVVSLDEARRAIAAADKR